MVRRRLMPNASSTARLPRCSSVPPQVQAGGVPAHAARLSLLPDLLELCHREHSDLRPVARSPTHCLAPPPLQPARRSVSHASLWPAQGGLLEWAFTPCPGPPLARSPPWPLIPHGLCPSPGKGYDPPVWPPPAWFAGGPIPSVPVGRLDTPAVDLASEAAERQDTAKSKSSNE